MAFFQDIATKFTRIVLRVATLLLYIIMRANSYVCPITMIVFFNLFTFKLFLKYIPQYMKEEV